MVADQLTPDPPRRSPSREQRHGVILFIWYSVLGHVNSDIAHTCDISEHGVGLYAPRALPVGERIFLEIATHKGTLSAVGTIIHCRPLNAEYHRVGVRLEIVPPNDRGLLTTILEK